jgi:hypothetical protein
VRDDGAYRWLNDNPIADAPQWLIDLAVGKGADELSLTQKSAASNDRNAVSGFEVAEEFRDLAVGDLGEGIETDRWWDRLSPDKKDAALDHGLECIANNSNLLKLGNNNFQWFQLVTSIARSGAPRTEEIFVKHAGAVPGADSGEALQKKLADCKKPRTETADITVGTFIMWARQCGANFEPWLGIYEEEVAGGNEPAQEQLEARIPADTLREIQNPRSKRLWNVLMVLKDKGYTVDTSLALFAKYPTGMAAKYRGRLQNEVEKIWAKLSEGEEPKTEMPPVAPIGPSITINETIEVFQRWLLLEDCTPVYAVLGAVAANYLDGDAVWLGVIGPPSSAKTEILNATSMLPHVVQAATLTVAGLLSGTPKKQQTAGAKGGLLQQMGVFGIIALKDLGSILSMHTETRAELLAALREIYDGEWTRHIGTDGGRTLAWKGKVGLVFAATGVIDSHYAVIGAMGDRFLLSRLAPTPGQTQFQRALAHLGDKTKQMRKELAEAVAQLFAGRRPQPAPISNEEANCIGEVISLTVRLRGAVERDRRTREIDAVYGAEGTARIGLALERLLAGLDTLGLERKKALEVVKAVALDSVPPLRRAAYEIIDKHNISDATENLTTTDIATTLSLPTTTTRRALEDLAAYGLVERQSKGRGKHDTWMRSNWETAETAPTQHKRKTTKTTAPAPTQNLEPLAAILTAWKAAIGVDKQHSLHQVINLADPQINQTLHAALLAVAPMDDGQTISNVLLARWLRNHNEVPVDGLMLSGGGVDDTGSPWWTLVPANDEPPNFD